jgi:hypothetical protein
MLAMSSFSHRAESRHELNPFLYTMATCTVFQKGIICLKRTAPKLYAVNDVVSKLNNYVKLGEFTEDDFRDIMMSDKGMLIIRLYLSWWAIYCVHYRSAKGKRCLMVVF